MRTKSLLIVLALLAGVVVLSWQNSPRAAACSCAVGTAAESASWADTVVEATVNVITISRGAGDTVYRATAHRVWKGEVPREFEFRTSGDDGSCTFVAARVGDDIMLFATQEDGMLFTHQCSGTTTSDAGLAADLTKALGEPQEIAPPPSPSPTAESTPEPASSEGDILVPLTVAGGVALIGVIALVVMVRGRRRTGL